MTRRKPSVFTGASTGPAWDSPGRLRVTGAGRLGTGARVTAFADFVVVAPPPVPLTADWGFSPAAPVVGEPVTFTDLSTGTPTSWTWQFEGATGSRTSSLRTPPPVGRPLAVTREDGRVELHDGATLVAEGRPAGPLLDLPHPAEPDPADTSSTR